MSRIRPARNSFDSGLFVHSDIDDAGLDVNEFRVYAHLCRRMNDQGRVWEGQGKIAKTCRLSRPTVNKALISLEERGWIHQVPRYRDDGGQSTNDIIVIGLNLRAAPPVNEVYTPRQSGLQGLSTTFTAEGNPVEGNPREGNNPPTPQGVELPEWLPEEVWGDWLQHRREIRKPMTATASQKLLTKLGRLRDQGHDPASLIDEAISNGWQSVYEPKAVQKVPGGARRPADQAAANQQFIERVNDTSAIKGVFE